MNEHQSVEERILEKLVESNIVEEIDGGIAPTETFRLTRSESLSKVHALEQDKSLEEIPESVQIEDFHTENRSQQVVATAMALEQFEVDFAEIDEFGVAKAVNRLIDPPPIDGVPEGFTPLRGDEIEVFMNRFPAAIVYCWRHVCDPCDLVKSDLENLFSDGLIPDPIGLGAVYAPNCPEVLRENYMVGVAPTLLFCVGGSIDSRLIGAHKPEAVHSEIQMISKRSERSESNG